MDPDTNQLVADARAGDCEAANSLIDLFYERVYAFLRRLAGNDSQAADLTQKTFSRVWHALGSFQQRSTVSSWIHGIAYHVYLDWRRAQRTAEVRSDEWWSTRCDPSPGPDELAARAEVAEQVFAAVDRLEPDLRETIHLRYYQELTIEETAEAVAVATSTVKYRVRQALDRLHTTIQPEMLGRA